jgi:hypothetical protein
VGKVLFTRIAPPFARVGGFEFPFLVNFGSFAEFLRHLRGFGIARISPNLHGDVLKSSNRALLDL